MYHEESDTPAMARTSNLNEELGMVIIFRTHCLHKGREIRSLFYLFLMACTRIAIKNNITFVIWLKISHT